MDNGKYNAVNIVHHIVIPKADYFVTQRFQIFCSFFIILFLFQMLTPIQFDNQSDLGSTEIGDVVANGMLTAESNT